MDTEDPIQDEAPKQGGGKGKKKKKEKKVMSLDEFLSSNDSGQVKNSNWAVMSENPDDEYETPFKFDRSTLPSAPKAALGPSVDLALIPKDGPFSVHIGNLSYDATEDDLYNFFSKLEIDSLRIITDNGRPRGYAYVDFKTRDALIEALTYHEKEYMGRTIRVDLASSDKNQDSRDNRGFSRSSGDPDRTEGDWRRRDPPTDNDGFLDRDRGGRYGDRDRGFSDRDRGFGRDRDRGYGGDRGFGDRDRDRGFGGDRDRGFGGDRDRGFGGDRDRGFGGDRDRGFGGDRDRGFGGDRDRDRDFGDRDRGFGGDRDRGFGGDRDRGFGGDRDRGFGDRDRGFGDRDRGFGGDRDRGFGGDRDRGFGGDRDRGYGGDRDRGYGGDRDRGYGGDRNRGYGDRDRGYDRDRGGYGDRDRYRDRGYGDRDRGYGDRDGRSNRGYGFIRDREDGRYGSRGDYGRRDDYGYQSRRDDDHDRRPTSRDGSPGSESSDAPRTRPVLKLKPRSIPKTVENDGQPASRSSIFGAAKPVDTYAKEREIEEKLQKETVISQPTRDDGDDRVRNRRQSGGDSSGHRRKSSNTATVIKPAPMGRRDSERSRNSEEGNGPEESRSPASPKATDAPAPKMVPAPPPKENPWTRKKDPSAAPVSPTQTGPNASNNASTPAYKKDSGPQKTAWGERGPPRSDGAPGRGDRKPPQRAQQDAKGDGGQRSRPVKEKALPKSIEDMPKYEETHARDFSDQNKFAFLSEDGEGYGDDDNDRQDS